MGEIITVVSAIAGNGAKYTATHLARVLTNGSDDKSVLMLDFDFDAPVLAVGLFEEEGRQGIDELLSVMQGGNIEDELFQSFIVETNFGADLLSGTALVGSTKHIHPEQILGILQKGKELYDYVVVVSTFDNNIATPYALSESNDVVLVLRQNHSNVKALPQVIQTMNHFCKETTSIWALFNYYTGLQNEYVNDLLGTSSIPFKVLGAIEYDVKSVDYADFGRRTGFLSKAPNEKEWNMIHSKIEGRT